MSKVKELSLIQIEPYDKWLSNVLQRLGLFDINSLLFDTFENADSNDDDDDDDGDAYLVTLDPKEWKNQDHYAIFGLKNKRINATDEEIKRAYRKKVLNHHPDKRHNEQEIDLDHDYFSCITKAYEILGDPIKRRSYDSIDPLFDNEIPSVCSRSKSHFFQVFAPIFKLNSRWSNINPVPEFGDNNSSKDKVNAFYTFWYNFDSWREYSYLDEEEKEKGQDREERRWMEKQNRAVRTQRKKEEMQRIRQLVDNAYHCDPRIQRFKEQEKLQKQEQKRVKQEAVRAKQLEEEKMRKDAEERDRRIKQEEDEKVKAKKDEEKRQKEAQKKQLRKERKQIEVLFEKYNYFADNDNERIDNLKEFDKICRIFTYEELISFRELFDSSSDANTKKQLFIGEVNKLNNKLEAERNALLHNSGADGHGTENQSSRKHWNYDDLQLLIKAVNTIKIGTHLRWEMIAEFVNSKSTSGVKRNHKDALEKVKQLQHSGQFQSIKEEANKNAFKTLENNVPNSKVDESAPTERFDAPNTYVELNPEPWSHEEQQILEQAIKTYPSSLGSERWDLIAECIPNRSRSDCIKRFKYLVEMVRTKNAIKASVTRAGK